MNLEALIKRNCNEIVDRQCKARIMSFISDTETILDRDLYFVMSLSKVIVNLLEYNSTDMKEELLERAHCFIQERIELLHKSQCSSSLSDELARAEAHLYGCSSDIARVIAKKTKNVKWGITAYNARRIAAEKSVFIDPVYSAYSDGFAADCASDVFNLTGYRDSFWAKKSYNYYVQCAERCVSFDRKHTAYCYRYATEMACIAFVATREKSWLKREYDSANLAAELFLVVDPKQFCGTLFYKSRAAYEMSVLNPQWTQRAIRACQEFIGISRLHLNRPDMEENITKATRYLNMLNHAV